MKRSIPLLALIILLVAVRVLSQHGWQASGYSLHVFSLPVTVTWRPAIDGSPVAQFHNNSTDPLTVNIKQTRSASAQQSQTIVLPPYSVTEEGWREGWFFQDGDVISVSNNSWSAFYDQVTVTVP